MNKEELFECLSGLSQTNNLRDGIDIRKEEANIIVNEIERLNNIINELEKEYINYMDKQDFAKKCKISRPYLDKLLKAMNRKEIYEFCKQRNKIKELKGSDEISK